MLRPRLLSALLLAAPAAHAQDDAPPPAASHGYDGNIDLIRPYFSPENLPGIDVPVNSRGGSVRWGVTAMYTNSPLVLYEFDEEVGSVINNRFATYVGASVDITRAVTARLTVPMYFQWGTEVPRYEADGFAFGDIGIGAHWAFYRKPAVSLGMRLDATLPTARRNFYAGERLPSLYPAFLMAFDVGRLRIASDLGANVRLEQTATSEELTIGSELAWNLGFRVNVVRERLDLGGAVYGRFGFADFFGPGESAGEFLVTASYKATDWLWVDIAGGRGFTRGYGSSDARAMLQLRFQKLRPEIPDEPEDFVDDDENDGDGGGLRFDVRKIGDIHADGEGGTKQTEEEWEQGVLARIEAERIKIRYAIQFRVGTAELLPESYPTLDFIADLLNKDARIAHVVIEGHASEDGPFDLNYELSQKRAASIWRRIVEQGVHPSRISSRGMGEVIPAEATGGYDELQASRRVVFHIVRQYEDWEKTPQYDLNQKYPWNGESYRAVQPKMPAEGSGDLMPTAPGTGAVPPKRDDSLKDVSFSTPGDDDITHDDAQDDASDDDQGESTTPTQEDAP